MTLKNRFRIAFSLLLISMALFPHLSAAQDAVDPPAPRESDSLEDELEMRRLLSVLDKHTEIATKSKLNTDYVPGTVTVLQGEDLQARGVQNVLEALTLVPGIETAISHVGTANVVIRGVGKTSVTGKVNIQLNGISVNSLFFGNGNEPLYLPIAQIERIEVIAGPGSAIHGEYAYSGVINVITRKDGNRLDGSVGSYNSFGAGGLFSFKNPKKDLSLSLNLAHTQTDGADIDSGEDQLYNLGMADISNAPGPTNEARSMPSAIFDLGFKGFSLNAFYIDRAWGDHFGLVRSLPPPDDRLSFNVKIWGTEAHQNLKLSPDTTVGVTLGFYRYEYAPKLLFVQPPGYLGIYEDGLLSRPYYQESRVNGGVDLSWKGIRNHTFILGYSVSQHNLDDVWQETNYVPSTGAPLDEVVRFTGDENWLDENLERLRQSITLQDEFKAGHAIDITAGFRYDHYDDVGSDLSPRIAAVWRMTERHIMKAQYARAFRPSTFSELYAKNSPVVLGNEDLKSETVDTYELGYIYRLPKTAVRTTLFYSELKDLIIPVNRVYTNAGETSVVGAELGLEQQLSRSLKLDGTLSYMHSDEDDQGAVVSEVASWLGNLGMLYEFTDDLVFSLSGRYVGDRKRVPLDDRDDLEGYFTMDTAGSIFNLWIEGLTLRAGIKNILDADIRDPAPITTDFLGNPVPTYAEDYPRPGRLWWASISYAF
ncbi:MAG: TonB-dependent receptor [Desulfobacterales bacterium]|nr:TonB-dependent receptor [Desulfobacterales bacterium]